MSIWTYRPEDNFWCWFIRQGLLLVWNFSSRPGYLASEPQGSTFQSWYYICRIEELQSGEDGAVRRKK